MHGNNSSFAEIIESTLEQCTAQTWRWDDIPLLGTLMIIHDPEYVLFGLVHAIHVGASDTTRVPYTYQKTPEELARDQPHIFAFLKTQFACLILGYMCKHDICAPILYTLAPKPARLHAFVQVADNTLQTDFFSTMTYMQLLFGAHQGTTCMDELLLAIVQRNNISAIFLRKFMQTYITLVGNDYRRVRLFAQRLHHVAKGI
jgi:hypothetical protein